MSYQLKLEDTYENYQQFALEQIDQMQDNFIMGKDNTRIFPTWTMIKTLMQLNYEMCPDGIIDEELKNCILDKDFCIGINADKMLKIWECGDDDDVDGIGYMQLESKPDEAPPDFIIR